MTIWVKSGGAGHLARASGVPSRADMVETANQPDWGFFVYKPARERRANAQEAGVGVLRCAQRSAPGDKD